MRGEGRVRDERIRQRERRVGESKREGETISKINLVPAIYIMVVGPLPTGTEHVYSHKKTSPHRNRACL